MSRWHPNTLRCYCHDQDVCPAYEAECSEQQEEEWLKSLTDEERESLNNRMCMLCYRVFKPKWAETRCSNCIVIDDDGEEFIF